MKRRPKPRRWALHTPTTVRITTPPGCPDFDPPISFTIPAGFHTFTPAQRKEWGREQIRQECDTLVRDLAQTLGFAPGPELEAVIARVVADVPLPDTQEGVTP